MFYVITDKDRTEWVEAIKAVANNLSDQDQQPCFIQRIEPIEPLIVDQAQAQTSSAQNIEYNIENNEDVEMGSIADDTLFLKFSRQGTSTGKISGKKKVVSWN